MTESFVKWFEPEESASSSSSSASSAVYGGRSSADVDPTDESGSAWRSAGYLEAIHVAGWVKRCVFEINI